MRQSFLKNEAITFVIPDVNAFQSGGNIYNKNLIDGLLSIGYSIKVMDWDTFNNVKEIGKGYYFFDTLYFAQLATFLPKKTNTAQFFLIVHHLESLYPPKNWTSKDYFLEKEYPILKLFDGFLTSSQFTANYLVDNYLVTKKIVLPPAINFQPIINTKKSTADIQAVMVANLVERKGILPFLKSLVKSPIIQQAKNLQLHLIGTNKMEPNYAEACLQLIEKDPELKKIISYHGQLSSLQVHSFYQEANLFLSTAFMETYGMSLQEARAFRLPILALKGGNVENHVENGRTGWLVDNMSEVVHRLENLVKRPKDLVQIQQCIVQQTSNNFYNWETAAKQFLLKLGEGMS